MKRFFDAELENFRSHLLQMGERAIDQTRLAMRALNDGDMTLADKVIMADDEVDKLEVKIDEEAIRYMTLRGPVASELRLIVVGMKASHDLERVGDEATGIARRSRKLAIEPKLELYADMPRMAAIALPPDVVRDAIAPHGDRVSLAAINSPVSVVIAGESDVVESLVAQWTAQGVSCRPLPVDYAFHSAQMEPFRTELTRVLGTVETRATTIPMLSTVTGAQIDGAALTADYWGTNIRQPVRLADAVRRAEVDDDGDVVRVRRLGRRHPQQRLRPVHRHALRRQHHVRVSRRPRRLRPQRQLGPDRPHARESLWPGLRQEDLHR